MLTRCPNGKVLLLERENEQGDLVQKAAWVECRLKSCESCWQREVEVFSCQIAQVLTDVASSQYSFSYRLLATNVKKASAAKRWLQRSGAAWVGIPLVSGDTAFFASEVPGGWTGIEQDEIEHLAQLALRQHDRTLRLAWSRHFTRAKTTPKWRLLQLSDVGLEQILVAFEVAGIDYIRVEVDSLTVQGLTTNEFVALVQSARDHGENSDSSDFPKQPR